MKLWGISDTHFLHDNIVKYCNRPWEPGEHELQIITNFNQMVSPDDIVIHTGDIAFGTYNYKYPKELLKHYYSQLNGTHILIRGNHDEENNEFYINELGFYSVHDYLILGTNFFCHYPVNEDKWVTKRQRELNQVFLDSGCTRLYHGHIHEKIIDDVNKRNTFKHINLCSDANGYKPVFICNL